MSQPLLSIVIANYNYGRFLSEAIESVLSQSCQDFELIICDGGSTDNSVEVIKKYADRIAWWCSEPDGGQSAAFNKGFSRARGKFLTWLNADDVMLPGTIAKLNHAAEKHFDCEWFVGGVLWLDPTMHIINCGRGRPFSEIRYREGNVSVWGPSSFFTKRLFDSVGGVDERFYYTMDADLWLRFARTSARYLPFCDYAWGLRLHPDAKMSGQNFGTDEAKRIHDEKVAKEKEMSMTWFNAVPATRISHLLSVSWLRVLGAKLDLCNWRGKLYSEVIK